MNEEKTDSTVKGAEIARLLCLMNKTDKAEFGDGQAEMLPIISRMISAVGELATVKEELKKLQPKNELEKARKAVQETQREQIDRLAAAFVKEVGSAQASKYELVQLQDKNVIRWYFRRRKR